MMNILQKQILIPVIYVITINIMKQGMITGKGKCVKGLRQFIK